MTKSDKLLDERLYEEAENVFSACLTRRPNDELTAFRNGLKAYLAALPYKHSEPKCTCTVDFSPCYKCQIDAVNMQSAKTSEKNDDQ